MILVNIIIIVAITIVMKVCCDVAQVAGLKTQLRSKSTCRISLTIISHKPASLDPVESDSKALVVKPDKLKSRK